MIPRIVVAATRSGAGKTTVATGLMAAFAARGLDVAGFKVGPDFIDGSYHALATGRPSRNLDSFLSGPEMIAPLLLHGARGCDLAVIEGVMGLYDGKAGAGELASTAHVAKLLRAPVLLVVDVGATGRSAAAIVHGFATFDPEVCLAGVVLNRVGSERHEQILRGALDPLRIPVVGALRECEPISTPGRHLGLVPVAERIRDARRAVEVLGRTLTSACDLQSVLDIGRSAPGLETEPWTPCPPRGPQDSRPLRIAVAGGPAFSFMYRENLELLSARGAELVPFDPAADESIPRGAGALYLGGGFPEVYGEQLSANRRLRSQVADFAASGGSVVAECGGLLYLCRTLDGRPMCGVLRAEARMTDRLTLGYRSATAPSRAWLVDAGTEVPGHEFHYSVVTPPAGRLPAWRVEGRPEGFAAGGVHASYVHTHWAAFPQFADRFVGRLRRRSIDRPPRDEAARHRRPSPDERQEPPVFGPVRDPQARQPIGERAGAAAP